MPQRISEDEIREQVLSLMSQLGISPAAGEDLILDGELHRYTIEGDRKGTDNGAYCIYTDGIPAGFIQDWKGIKTKWKYDSSKLSPEERSYYASEEYEKKATEERERRKAEREARELEASEHARVLFESLNEAPKTHKYLIKKAIQSHGLKIQDQSLVVPLRDGQGIVRSIQWIQEDGTKRFYPGANLKGLYWSVGLKSENGNPKEIYLCEGMATGAKIYEVTKKAVVSAITCHNLEDTAKNLKELYPKSEVIIFADDDGETERKRKRNPGIETAQKVVKNGHASLYISPPFEKVEDGTDWDDYALKYGEERCAREIENQIETARKHQKRERYELDAKRLGLLTSTKFVEFCRPVNYRHL